MQTFRPEITADTPAVVRELAGKPLDEAARALAVAVQCAEARFAALIKLPGREVPFTSPRSAPPAVKALDGKPSSEVAAALARELAHVEADVRYLRAALAEAGWSSSGLDYRLVIRMATSALATVKAERGRRSPRPSAMEWLFALFFARQRNDQRDRAATVDVKVELDGEELERRIRQRS